MKYLFFGLGNPGKEYEKTRHNAGQLLLDGVAFLTESDGNGVHIKEIDKKKSIEKNFYLSGHEVRFIYPAVFMNNSGGFVKQFRSPENFIVIVYDDIDLPFGEVRLSYNKSGGSHNGVLSVVKSLGTQKFITLRMGISKTNALGKINRISGKGNVQEFVMKNFSHDELEYISKDLSKKTLNIIKLLIDHGLEKTLSIYKSNI